MASLAGKLLQESESSSASTNASEGNNQAAFGKDAIKQDRQDKLLKEECFEQGSSEESAVASEISSPDIDEKFIPKRFLNAALVCNSNKSDFVYNVSDDIKSPICNSRPAFKNYPSKVGGCPLAGESYDANVENGIGIKKGERLESAGFTMPNTCSSNDSAELQVEFPTMVSSDNDVKLSLREAVPNASFSRHRNDIKLVGRDDDDENFSRRSKPSTKVKASKHPTRVGDSRIRKLLTSKYWKTVPKLRDCEVFRSGKLLMNYVVSYQM